MDQKSSRKNFNKTTGRIKDTSSAGQKGTEFKGNKPLNQKKKTGGGEGKFGAGELREFFIPGKKGEEKVGGP